jgi:quercetin dioxygenase-like cupin family protein
VIRRIDRFDLRRSFANVALTDKEGYVMTFSRKGPFQLLARITALALVILPIAACGLGTPPAPTMRFQSHCEAANVSAQVDAYQAVWSFTPGTWTTRHSHPGPVCVSMLEGGITFRLANSEKSLTAGESLVEPANEVHTAGNWTGSSSLMLVTNLAPRGKAPSAVVDGTQTAVRTYFNLFQPNQVSEKITVTHTVLDFAAGAWTPANSQAGETLNSVLSGTVTLRQNGTDKTFKAGEFWSNDPDQVYAVGNTGSIPASVFVSYLQKS